jgi:hypothetical protein
MRTLETVQEQRSKQAHLVPVPLVKLELYSNRDAGTVGATFYFSDRSVSYDYGNTGTVVRFEPWLAGFGELATGIVHLADSGQAELVAKRFGLSLRNAMALKDEAGDDASWRVVEILREDYAIEGATIEVAQLLIPKIKAPGPLDLTAYDGDEHTVFYRGRISRLGPLGDEIQLQCETDEPRFKWGRAVHASEVSPRDMGARYPRPYGQITRLPLVGRKVAWVTTLAVALNATETGTKAITLGTGFPASGTFYVWCNGERMTCTASSDTTLTISARGADATVHNAGSVLAEEIDEAVWVVADDGAAPVANVDALYIRSPFTERIVRVTTGYTFTAEDTTVDTGKTLSTITMSQDNLRGLSRRSTVSQRAHLHQRSRWSLPVRLPMSLTLPARRWESGARMRVIRIGTTRCRKNAPPRCTPIPRGKGSTLQRTLSSGA